MTGRFTIEGVFTALDMFSRPVAAMQTRAEGLQKSLSKMSTGIGKIDSINNKIAGGFKRLGVAALAGGAVAGAALYDIVTAGADFEHQLVSAAGKFDPAMTRNTAAFKELKNAALDMGSASEFGATNAAAALDALAAAGLKPAQAIALLPGTMSYATASASNLSEGVEVATKSLGAFNLMTEDTAQLTKNLSRVTDTLAMASNITNANSKMLFETIKEGGPIATTAGQSLETFLAFAGQLANAGIEGTVAGTTLKNMFLSLAAPTTEASAALAKLGIKTKDTKGNLLDSIGIMGELEKKTKDMGTAAKAATLEKIFGKIPLAGISALLSGGINKVAEFREQYEKAGGSNAKIAALMRSDMKGSIDMFAASVEGVKISIADVVAGPLQPMLTGLASWANANKDVISTKVSAFLAEAIPWVKSFAAGVGDGATAVAGFGEKVSFVITPLEALFGKTSGDRIENARSLGSTIVKVGAGFFAFSLLTKTASGAVALFGLVTKAVQGTVWLFETAVKGVRSAFLLYEIASKAGVGATVAMSFASKAASADLVLQRAAAFGAAGGFQAMAVTAGAAAAAIGALMLAKAANDDLKNQTEGMGIGDIASAMWKKGTWDPFKVVDEHQNALARARVAEEEQASSLNGATLGVKQLDGINFDKLAALPNGVDGAQAAQLNSLLAAALAGPQAQSGDARPASTGSQVIVSRDAAAAQQQADVRELIRTLKDNAKNGAGEIRIKTDAGTEAEVTKQPKGIKITPTGRM